MIGTIRFWPVRIDTAGDSSAVEAILLGPLAVHPDFRGHGIAPRLVDAGLSAAGNLGYRVVFAVGDLAYLGRFGFSPASTANLASAVEVPVAAKRFFVLGLDESALEGLDGTVVPAAN